MNLDLNADIFKRNYKQFPTGSFFVIAQARYLGKRVQHTKTGDRNFYYLDVLFYHKDKDTGKLTPKPRELTLSGKPDSEFNLFLKGVLNQTVGMDLNFETVGKTLENYFNTHTINVKAQFEKEGRVPFIRYIDKVSKIYVEKEPGMVWPAYFLPHRPQLLNSSTATEPLTLNENKHIDPIKAEIKRRKKQAEKPLASIIPLDILDEQMGIVRNDHLYEVEKPPEFYKPPEEDEDEED